ncbi:MAG TPA: zinc-dependent metalloprotease [Planctomycetota bacterium]|nr:zinc-dependent metalloprotease [Planctomycetota bacterium]
MARKRSLVVLALLAFAIGGGIGNHTVAQDVPHPRPVAEFPAFDQVTDGYDTYSGLFTVYRKKNHLLLEVPEWMQGRPFLLAMSVSGGSTLAGHQVDDIPAVFDRVDKKLLLLEKEVHWKGDDRKPLGEVVKRTYSDSVRRAVNIQTLHGTAAVVDLVDLLGNGGGYQGPVAFFGRFGAALDPSVCRVTKLKVFPQNIELELTMPNKTTGQMTTIAYSFSSLPDPRMDEYLARRADDRIGYFLTAYKDFSDDKASGDRFVRLIHRWDLRKADPTLAVSPPKKPIVFYIEKTVPYRYRKAVQDGILEWNKAFEKCGFSGAIVVRQQTADNEFKDFDPEDVQYNFFRWITSERAFARGPSRVNPFTGQILNASIVFDDSMARYYLRDYEERIRKAPGKLYSERLQKLLLENPDRYPFAHLAAEPDAVERELASLPSRQHDECTYGEGLAHELAFSAMAGLVDAPGPQGRKEFPEEFIYEILKDTVMHEVGHTLGLRHNFKGSTWKPLAELNTKDAPEAISGSVMDYNAVNVRATRDVPQGRYACTTIGPYDYWAIEYGYREFAELPDLKAIASRVEENGLAYATDEDTVGPDPLVNRWDLGQDPLEFADHRMKIATQLWKDLVDRVVTKGEGYQDARRGFDMVLYDYMQSGIIAARFVGGEYVRRDHKGDPNEKDPIEVVEAKKQRDALHFVCEKVFSDANYKFPPELVRKLAAGRWSHWGSTDLNAPVSYPFYDRVLAAQQWPLFQLTNPETLERLVASEAKVGENEDLLTLAELFETLDKAIFAELDSHEGGPWTVRKPMISTIRRNLQRAYLKLLIDIAIERDGPTPQIARTLVWHRLKGLEKKLAATLKAMEGTLDAYTAAHLDEARTRIEKALDASFTLNVPAAPSGGGEAFKESGSRDRGEDERK